MFNYIAGDDSNTSCNCAKCTRTKANKPCEFPKFTPLDSLEMARLTNNAVSVLLDIPSITRLLGLKDEPEIIIDSDVIEEIIEKIEKRRVYFHIYHGVEMGELNEVALVCFWVLKFMPFKCANRKISNSNLNTTIAFLFFIKVLYRINSKLKIDKTLMHNLFYSFRHRDLSKEAIMILAESLSRENS